MLELGAASTTEVILALVARRAAWRGGGGKGGRGGKKVGGKVGGKSAAKSVIKKPSGKPRHVLMKNVFLELRRVGATISRKRFTSRAHPAAKSIKEREGSSATEAKKAARLASAKARKLYDELSLSSRKASKCLD